jgi:serine phosphatase RsbU (regulator of sigma subunit)
MVSAGAACCCASLLPIVTTAQAWGGGHPQAPGWSRAAPGADAQGHGPGAQQEHGPGAAQGGGWGRQGGEGHEGGGYGGDGHEGGGSERSWGGHGPAEQSSGQASPETQSGGGSHGSGDGGGPGWGRGGSGDQGGGHGSGGQGGDQGGGHGPGGQGGGHGSGGHGWGRGGSGEPGESGDGQGEAGQAAESTQGGGHHAGDTWQGGPNSGAHGNSAGAPGSRAQHASSSSTGTTSPAQSPSAAAPGSGSAASAASSAGAPAPASTPAAAPTASFLAPSAKRTASGGSTKPRTRHRARHGRPHAKGSRGAHARGGLAKPTGALVAATTGAAAGASAARHGAAKRGSAAKESSTQTVLPPVVRTITRIVSVVPLPLRILIGALMALAIGLAVRSRVAARRTRRLEQQRSALLEDVGLLQAALLPGSPQRLGTVGTSTAYRPAGGPAAGGDFYDLFALEDGRLAAIVGDVSGHGRQALPHTALTRFTLRAYLEAGFSPREALATAGTALERQLGDSFATVAIATYQPRDRTLTYACAGHPHPIVLGSRPLATVSAASAPPIGAGMRTGTRQTVIGLPGGARVCLHTDGVTDARIGSELYGLDRLTRELAKLGPQAGAQELLDRVAAQTDAQPDDMAACLLEIPGGERAPQVLHEELQLDAEQARGARAGQFLLACGVPQEQVAGILDAAREEALRAGGALLEVQPAHDGGAPKVTVRPDNVAAIHTAQVRRELVGAR